MPISAYRMGQRLKGYALRFVGSAVWLLPALGIVAWAVSGVGLDWWLSRAYTTEKVLKLTASPAPPVVVVAIDVSIHRQQQFSIATVRTAGSPLRTLKFEFPVSDLAQIEAAIAQELGVSRSQVNRLMRVSVK